MTLPPESLNQQFDSHAVSPSHPARNTRPDIPNHSTRPTSHNQNPPIRLPILPQLSIRHLNLFPNSLPNIRPPINRPAPRIRSGIRPRRAGRKCQGRRGSRSGWDQALGTVGRFLKVRTGSAVGRGIGTLYNVSQPLLLDIAVEVISTVGVLGAVAGELSLYGAREGGLLVDGLGEGVAGWVECGRWDLRSGSADSKGGGADVDCGID